MQKATITLALCITLTGMARHGAFAQDEAKTNPQSATSNGRNPQSEARIGVNPSKRVTLTLRDAMSMALDYNRDIEIERLNVQMNEFDLRAAQGVYDPALAATFYYDRRSIPATSIFAADKTDNLIGTATFTQRTPWQGSSLTGVFDNNRATTTNPFNSLNPQYTTNLNFTFTQPLFRNRTVDSARRQIRISKKRLDISDSQFRQRAIEIISQVQRAYWELVFSRRDQEIKRESVDLAETQLEHNERLVDAGTLAKSDIISARVELERRKDEAEAAVEAIQRAENSLKALMAQPGDGGIWQSELVPVEQPQIETGASLPLEDALRLAAQNRPEMEQYRLRGELNKIDAEYLRNQTKPQIDFFVTYGTVGLAGPLRATENPINASNEILYGRINQLSALAELPLLPIANTGATPGALVGGYGQSLSNLFKNDFRSWRVGLNINLPLRNRTAQANFGRSLAEGKQIEAQRQKTEQLIEVEVRNALQAVETARKRVDAAKNSRVNAELQYQSEQRKFDAGQSTNFFVLDRQNALSSARGRELRALTDYTKAVAELQRALSTTLSSNNVEVK
ncbi:MAG TPA: TolC family protein [Blastocatellia bacterium]|nr:TolC family protein [Blastocatellia bacterium]